MRESVQQIIENIVHLLVQTSKKEANDKKKEEKKKFTQLGGFDSEDSEDDDELYSEEDDEDSHESEDDGDRVQRDNAVNDLNTHMKSNSHHHEADDLDDEHDDQGMENEINLHTSYEAMQTSLSQFDEFMYFRTTMQNIYKKHKTEVDTIIASMNIQKKTAFQGIINTRTISTEDGQTYHRRVVRVKRKS